MEHCPGCAAGIPDLRALKKFSETTGGRSLLAGSPLTPAKRRPQLRQAVRRIPCVAGAVSQKCPPATPARPRFIHLALIARRAIEPPPLADTRRACQRARSPNGGGALHTSKFVGADDFAAVTLRSRNAISR
jgi:hypothetical protein